MGESAAAADSSTKSTRIAHVKSTAGVRAAFLLFVRGLSDDKFMLAN